MGRSMRFGSRAVVRILQRDSRCMMVTLDPDSTEKAAEILKTIAQRHNGQIGIYGAALVEGMIRKGDAVELID